MYFFGIAALDRFKTKLKDYPQYCQVLGRRLLGCRPVANLI
jgi:hypothetical protein